MVDCLPTDCLAKPKGGRRLNSDERQDAVTRLIRGESARKLAVEYGVTRQAIDALRERHAVPAARSMVARIPEVRHALDDRDAAVTTIAEHVVNLLADSVAAREAGNLRQASNSVDTAVRGLNTIASWRGWVQKPTNAAELQTSDTLASVVAAWMASQQPPTTEPLAIEAECVAVEAVTE